MKCSECGAEIRDDAKFCTECGKPIKKKKKIPIPAVEVQSFDPSVTTIPADDVVLDEVAAKLKNSSDANTEANIDTNTTTGVEADANTEAGADVNSSAQAPAPDASQRVDIPSEPTQVLPHSEHAPDFVAASASTRTAGVASHAAKKGLSDAAKIGIIVGSAAAVLVVGIVAAVLIISGSSSQSSQSSTETSMQTAPQEQTQSAEPETAENQSSSQSSRSERAQASDNDLREYTNVRFGFRVSVPLEFDYFTNSDNGGDMSFDTTASDITISASGTNNTNGATVQSRLKMLQDRRSDPNAYIATGDDWFVYSYTWQGYIYYYKEYVGSGSINSIQIRYPQSQSDEGDALVEEIIPTFTRGYIDKAC